MQEIRLNHSYSLNKNMWTMETLIIIWGGNSELLRPLCHKLCILISVSSGQGKKLPKKIHISDYQNIPIVF